ncbi:MAG: type II toxin-antitoxin system RelE/ParE family toxin [Limisphaerales bacterium]
MKQILFHPEIEEEIASAMDYYEEVSGTELANEFHYELIAAFHRAAETPTRFHPVTDTLRRVNLKRFTYHFLFSELSDRIRILVFRHHRRDPEHGMDRE